MKSTIYDVAKAAGVSIATVSKVVNQTGNISAKTRERVLHIMKELQYQPSVVASALTGKKRPPSACSSLIWPTPFSLKWPAIWRIKRKRPDTVLLCAAQTIRMIKG